MILGTITQGPIHGYGIAQRILLVSREPLQVRQGSLYPALHRLEGKRLIKADWRPSDSGPMAKYYVLTAAGEKRLKEETAEWRQYASAVALVLQF